MAAYGVDFCETHKFHSLRHWEGAFKKHGDPGDNDDAVGEAFQAILKKLLEKHTSKHGNLEAQLARAAELMEGAALLTASQCNADSGSCRGRLHHRKPFG